MNTHNCTIKKINILYLREVIVSLIDLLSISCYICLIVLNVHLINVITVEKPCIIVRQTDVFHDEIVLP